MLDEILCGRSPRVGEVILVDDTRAGDVTLGLAILLFVAPEMPLLVFLLGEIVFKVFVVSVRVLDLFNVRMGFAATLAGLAITSSVELVLTLLRDLARVPVGMPDEIPCVRSPRVGEAILIGECAPPAEEVVLSSAELLLTILIERDRLGDVRPE
jgi:hypothetical protein